MEPDSSFNEVAIAVQSLETYKSSGTSTDKITAELVEAEKQINNLTHSICNVQDYPNNGQNKLYTFANRR